MTTRVAGATTVGRSGKQTARRAKGDPAYAKKTVKQLRKEASAKKKRHCPATSKMQRVQLIEYLKK